MVTNRSLPILPWGLLLLVATACEGGPEPGEAPALPPVVPEAVTSPWASEGLRQIVDLQVERDAQALIERLADPDPEIRGRAALALASVQAIEAEGPLRALLGDDDSGVRLEAAFALGQFPLADDGRALLDRLGVEDDMSVRVRLIEALGKRAGGGVAGALATLEAAAGAESEALALALSRVALRQQGGDGVIEALLDRVEGSDARVRTAAAYYFGRIGNAERWDAHVDRLRQVLDGLDRDDEAAMHLLLALGVRRDRSDEARFRSWLQEGSDWRIRANAARAMGTVPLLELTEVRDALIEAIVNDPSEHVAVAAASTFTLGVVVPVWGQDWMESWILEGPVERWRSHLPMIEALASYDRVDALVAWVQRMERVSPVAVWRGVIQLATLQGSETLDLLEDLARRSDDAVVRAQALEGLSDRVMDELEAEERVERVLALGERALERGEPVERVRAIELLARPTFGVWGGHDFLVEAFPGSQVEEIPVPVLTEWLLALATVGTPEARDRVTPFLSDARPRVRRAAAASWEALTGQPSPEEPIEGAERRVDWVALEALGPAPRLHLETEHGEIVVRLAPEQAPLTVETIASMAAERLFDGTRFHRVVPNFVVQGGDFSLGDGMGDPGYAIRSEFTRIPFERGVIGMASSGRDTEGSQFFLMHSRQPHLDGGYTAFGWVESGGEVLDRIMEGDRLLRARVRTDS